MRLNGIDVDRWSLRQRDLTATWSATLRVVDPVVVGPGTLEDDEGNEWTGTIVRVTETGSLTMANLIGCPVLNVSTRARFYAGGASGQAVLADYCADAGARCDPTELPRVPQWRARGDVLAVEVSRLARALGRSWRVSRAGLVTLEPLAGDAEAPGTLLSATGPHRRYAVDGVPELVGAEIDGWTIGQALVSYDGSDEPSATLWQASTAGLPAPNGVAGTVQAQSANRLDVKLDTGEVLIGIPLWSGAGYVPTLDSGARVIVLDLADDPRATIALSGAFDAKVSRVDISGDSDSNVDLSDLSGRSLRYGDTIMMPSGGPPAPLVIAGPPTPTSASKVRT